MNKLGGVASNPSGMAVCYNLPFLDRQTGVFEAELRIFNITAPSDEWVGVTSNDVTVSFSYLGATVQSVKRPQAIPSVKKRQSDGAPVFIKALHYVGRLNDNVIGSSVKDAQLRPLLVPRVGLSADPPGGGDEISTQLSSTEASFVNGVFSNSKAGSPVTPDIRASATALADDVSPFIMPGTTLGTFPIGLVITLAWTLIFVGAVGLGTLGRMQFRDQFRRRKRREQWDQQRRS